MSDVQVRRARVAELDSLVELWMEMMREHERFDARIRLRPDAADQYRAYLQHSLLDTNAFVIVALRAGEPVGYTLALRCDNLPMFEPDHYGYISDMVVDPAERSTGIGQMMFDRVSDWLRSQGIASFQLQVYSGNDGGHRFWQRQGFEPYLHRLWQDL